MAFSDLTPDTQRAVNLLFDFAERRFGVTPTINSDLRTCAQQNSLFDQGRSTGGRIVTNARGCISWHVLGRAVDIHVPNFGEAEYTELGRFWERLGGFWGGRIAGLDDFGHFEWHPGVSINQVCPNPDSCSSAVASSRAMSLAPTGGAGSEVVKIFLIAGVVFGAWAAADYVTRKTGGYGRFRIL